MVYIVAALPERESGDGVVVPRDWPHKSPGEAVKDVHLINRVRGARAGKSEEALKSWWLPSLKASAEMASRCPGNDCTNFPETPS